MADAKLIVKILTDASDSAKGIEQAEGKFGKFNDTMGSLVGPATAVLGGVVAIGAGALDAASDVQQAMGGVDAVFGESAGKIKQWAKDAAGAAGLSESSYGSLATTMGAQLKNMGVPLDDVADSTGTMIQLGADLAAQFGGSSADAVAALSSALRGEADPAEKYGLALNTTAVNAELAAQGLDGLEGPQLQAAKAAAIMKLASEQAGGAVGAYAREADTLAGSQATATAEWENAAAALGETLLPIITPVVKALGEFAQFVQENIAIIGPLIAVIGILAAAVIAYTAVQWLLNIALTANPIGIIIVAIVALIAGIVLLIASNEEARNKIIKAWEAVTRFFGEAWTNIVNGAKAAFKWIEDAVGNVADFFSEAWQNAVNIVVDIIGTLQDVFKTVFDAIKRPIDAVVGAFDAVIGAIKSVIDWLGRIKIPDVLGTIGGMVGGLLAPAPSAAALGAGGLSLYRGGPVAVPSRGSVGGASGGTVINIQGGLDSADAIARRVQQVLTSRDRRSHGVTLPRSAH